MSNSNSQYLGFRKSIIYVQYFPTYTQDQVYLFFRQTFFQPSSASLTIQESVVLLPLMVSILPPWIPSFNVFWRIFCSYILCKFQNVQKFSFYIFLKFDKCKKSVFLTHCLQLNGPPHTWSAWSGKLCWKVFIVLLIWIKTISVNNWFWTILD